MPTPITRGAASALGFGFLSVSKTHWITFGSQPFILSKVYLLYTGEYVVSAADGVENLIFFSVAGLNTYQTSRNFTSDLNINSIKSSLSGGWLWSVGQWVDVGNKASVLRRNNGYSPYTFTDGVVTDLNHPYYADISTSTQTNNLAVCGQYTDGAGTFGMHVGLINVLTLTYVGQRRLVANYTDTVTVTAIHANQDYIFVLGTVNTAVWLAQYANSASLPLQWQTKLTPASGSSTPTSVTAVDFGGSIYMCANNVLFKFTNAGSLTFQKQLDTGIVGRTFSATKLVLVGSSIYVAGTVSNNPGNTTAAIVKFNSSGVLQWSRIFYDNAANPLMTCNGLEVVALKFTISGKDSFDNVFVANLPTSGDLTGAYSNISPAITYTYADAGWTASNASFTQSTPTYTETADSATLSAPPTTYTSVLSRTYYKLPV